MATTKKTDRTAEVAPSLSTLAAERIRLKAEADAAAERLKAFDEALIEAMRKADVTKVETEVGKVNLIQSTTTVWNEEVLKSILTTAQWKRIIVEKVDRQRLDAEVLINRINKDDIEVARSEKQSKPFIR